MLPKFGDFMHEMGETEKARLLASLGSLGTPQERRNVRISGESSIHGGLHTDPRNDMFKDVKKMLKDTNLKNFIPNTGKTSETSSTKMQEGFFKVIQKILRVILLVPGGNHYAATINWLLGIRDAIMGNADDTNKIGRAHV